MWWQKTQSMNLLCVSRDYRHNHKQFVDMQSVTEITSRKPVQTGWFVLHDMSDCHPFCHLLSYMYKVVNLPKYLAASPARSPRTPGRSPGINNNRHLGYFSDRLRSGRDDAYPKTCCDRNGTTKQQRFGAGGVWCESLKIEELRNCRFFRYALDLVPWLQGLLAALPAAGYVVVDLQEHQ